MKDAPEWLDQLIPDRAALDARVEELRAALNCPLGAAALGALAKNAAAHCSEREFRNGLGLVAGPLALVIEHWDTAKTALRSAAVWPWDELGEPAIRPGEGLILAEVVCDLAGGPLTEFNALPAGVRGALDSCVAIPTQADVALVLLYAATQRGQDRAAVSVLAYLVGRAFAGLTEAEAQQQLTSYAELFAAITNDLESHRAILAAAGRWPWPQEEN